MRLARRGERNEMKQDRHDGRWWGLGDGGVDVRGRDAMREEKDQ